MAKTNFDKNRPGRLVIREIISPVVNNIVVLKDNIELSSKSKLIQYRAFTYCGKTEAGYYELLPHGKKSTDILRVKNVSLYEMVIINHYGDCIPLDPSQYKTYTRRQINDFGVNVKYDIIRDEKNKRTAKIRELIIPFTLTETDLSHINTTLTGAAKKLRNSDRNKLVAFDIENVLTLLHNIRQVNL